mmetsp:Transcript_6643/g.9128  ORF Transcript_6643/g.9128 Transcript_6643/m.9128 type:complete len:182 (-) Transcript_6643:15-560(-)
MSHWTSPSVASAPPPLSQSTFTPRAAGLLGTPVPPLSPMPPMMPRAGSWDAARHAPVVSLNLVGVPNAVSHTPMPVAPMHMQPQVQRLSSVPILPLAQTITESPAVWPPPRASSFNSESMGVEGKINRWLGTIAIGSGAERGWDQAQVAEIALFAQDQHLDQLPAEEIYRRYVEYQVERAG